MALKHLYCRFLQHNESFNSSHLLDEKDFWKSLVAMVTMLHCQAEISERISLNACLKAGKG